MCEIYVWPRNKNLNFCVRKECEIRITVHKVSLKLIYISYLNCTSVVLVFVIFCACKYTNIISKKGLIWVYLSKRVNER